MGKKLFVFDLDFTIWDAGGTWCDCTIPPYKMENGKLLDSEGAHIRIYPEVTMILEQLKAQGKKVAIASRTTSPRIARKLMDIFDLNRFVDFEEIFPASKNEHFIKIATKSKVEFRDMVFFDDESRNINDVSLLGVECVQVFDGLNRQMVMQYV